MKLGYNTGYWSSGPPDGVEEVVQECDKLGFEHIWTAEAYGSDALSPLAWWGSHTENVKLGTAIMQMSARTPAATAMAAITMDHLSNGRFILGLGASGPQVVEGWYGQPYPRPLERTREYVEIVRSIVDRKEPVEFSGKHYSMPFPEGTGLGKPLKSTVHPLLNHIPVYLAAEGPKMCLVCRNMWTAGYRCSLLPKIMTSIRMLYNQALMQQDGMVGVISKLLAL